MMLTRPINHLLPLRFWQISGIGRKRFNHNQFLVLSIFDVKMGRRMFPGVHVNFNAIDGLDGRYNVILLSNKDTIYFQIAVLQKSTSEYQMASYLASNSLLEKCLPAAIAASDWAMRCSNA